MFFANDSNKNRIAINDYSDRQDYYCPLCGEKVIAKRGTVRQHHFAHIRHTECDGWHYDMSEWHIQWQEMFPEEAREHVFEHNGKRHIADVFINDTIIEFQHSQLSCDEFEERNSFYISLGYRVFWVFDVCEEYDNEAIEESTKKDDLYVWKRPKSTFRNFDSKDSDITIFLDFGFYNDDVNKDKKIVKRVIWVSPDGFKRFMVEKNKVLNQFDFVEIVTGKRVNALSIDDIFDDMYEHRVANYGSHVFKFFGCPISSEGYALGDDFDGTRDGYGICSKCKYSFDYYKCKYPRESLELTNRTDIIDIFYDSDHFIKGVKFIDNGVIKTKEIRRLAHKSGTIIGLWNELNNVAWAIFYSEDRKKYVKITKDPNLNYQKYKRIYGYISESTNFGKNSEEIYYFDEPIWKCVRWNKK